MLYELYVEVVLKVQPDRCTQPDLFFSTTFYVLYVLLAFFYLKCAGNMKLLVSTKLEIGNIFNKSTFLKLLFINNDKLTRHFLVLDIERHLPLKHQCFAIFIAVSRENKIKPFLFRCKYHAFNL